ncbi:MAG: cytidine/deoxycytidylate deaminase family protein [Candidatus Omnitrophota bacterium]
MRKELIKRPSWDLYFLEIAAVVSKRSTCLRRRVGAVIVGEQQILSTGYNGAPRHLTHCDSVGCIRQKENIPSGERHELCRGLHAEMNALLQAAYYGVRVKGAVVYCTAFPCSICAKMLVNAGVKKIMVLDDYPDPLSKKILAEAKINVKVVKK